MNKKSLEMKRIWIYLAFSFGIAWATALVIYLTGGLVNSPLLGVGVSLAFVLLATVYMGAPALANVITRLITKEGWGNAGLRPEIKRSWLFWVLAWVGPAILTILGAAVFFLIFPRFFDPQLTTLQQLLEKNAAAAGVPLPAVNLWVVVASQIIQAILIAPLVNGLSSFGEEFGWRAYLQPKLMVLGGRKAMLLVGVIWGVWHWPITLMGHNYGLDYPGHPWLGPLAMLWFCMVVGTFIGWLTLKGRSVWPAVIAHAALNGIAGISGLLAKGAVNPVLGPSPAGFIGVIGFTIVALAIFLSPRGLTQFKEDGVVNAEIMK
jgi:membrane protease YdiL (CAAX protease family)